MKLIIVLCASLLSVIVFSSVSCIASGNGTIFLNEVQTSTFSEYESKNGTVYLPIREIYESLGYLVSYDEKTRTIEVFDGKQTFQIPITKDSRMKNDRYLDSLENIKIHSQGYQVQLNESQMKLSIFQANRYQSRLYVPTNVFKFNNDYFIVDHGQHRIVYNDNLHDPISSWKTLSDTLNGPHSMESDGELIVVDEGGSNSVSVFKKSDTGYYLSEQVKLPGEIISRPHRTIYDPVKKLFYVYDSNTNDIVALKNIKGKLTFEFIKHLDFQDGVYTRGASIIDGKMYVISGPQKITEVNYLDDSFSVIARYDIPEDLKYMNDIVKIGDYFYISASFGKLIKVKDLSDIIKGQYEDLYFKYNIKDNPYFFSFIDGRVFMAHTDNGGIYSFKVENEKIVDYQTHYEFPEALQVSLDRRKERPY